MRSLAAGALAGCLTKKLRAQERKSTHRKFLVFDDEGELVATTGLSHGWRKNTQLSASMISTIRRELGLRTTDELFQLVDCSLSRTDYLAIVGQNT